MWKLLISAVLWIVLTIALNRSWQIGQISLPPLGKFFSPGQGFWKNAEPADPKFHKQDMVLGGLKGEVQILFDERMVPHIFAQNNADAYYAQGYVTAMHRLWQMDISTRAAAGELSKFLGPRTASFDIHQRRMGMGFAAENAVKGWQQHPEDMALLDAYVAGVNAYINGLKPNEWPVEFKLLDYAPEQWSVLKTALFAKSMATRLCLEEDDLEHTMLLKWLGEERFNALFPAVNKIEDPIIPPGTLWGFESTTSDDGHVPATVDKPTGPSTELNKDYEEGSNNWAVAGSRTASGKPILCNDPHLGLSLPSVWYEIQIVTPEQNAYGVSLPGTFGIIIGFNESIAWGMTNTGHDVLDWYEIKWTDAEKTTYTIDNNPRAAEQRIEKVEVRGHETIYDTVLYTVWGPIEKEGPHAGMAMRWLAHDIPDTREASMFARINHAGSFEEFSKVLSDFQTPAQNFVFADKQGNIGLRIGGKLPLRKDKGGRFVQDGSHSSAGWTGGITAAENPGVLNPSRGFVSSANQQTTDTTYPHVYFGGFEDFRGRILNRYLNSMNGITPMDMQMLQQSNESLKAEELLPFLLDSISASTADETKAVEILGKWKYSYEADAEAPILFDLWYDAFYKLLWDDFYAMADSISIYTPQAWRTNYLVMHEPQSEEFDVDSTSAKETFKDIASVTFQRAVKEWSTLDSDHRTWGSYRQTKVQHLANIPSFSRLLTTSGHGDALNATTRTHGPSWRMVVHLTDPVEAYVVYPGGQSGNPGSPYYDMMVDAWNQGEYFTPHYLRTPDELQPTEILKLKPGK